MKNSQSKATEYQHTDLNNLRNDYTKILSLDEKIKFLNSKIEVLQFFDSNPNFLQLINKLHKDEQLPILALVAIGQGPQVFQDADITDKESLQDLVDNLKEIEEFYEPIGGIIGYHTTFLELLKAQESPSQQTYGINYIKPEGLHINQETRQVREAVKWGIETLPQIAEIYTVGGAGERLQLIEEATGLPKPVGHLPLLGETLFSLMIQDIQAREFLYFKIFGKQLITPIAMMTSHEKDNHVKILEMCEEMDWFGRGKENFITFIQPLVPVISKDGNWSVSESLKLFLKPGGHGAIWKLAQDKGVIDWLKKFSRTKALIRQINNPAAGIDNGLLALCGIGVHHNKSMGFASCDRRVNANEGMDILIEKEISQGFEYGITNIEYTDFATKGIKDAPEFEGGLYSKFPANTNILFLDLPSVKEALKKIPIPGILVNLKTTCPTRDKNGVTKESQGGRLESTMQNIADGMFEKFSHKITPDEAKNLKTFLTYNKRQKTIITAKKAYVEGESFHDTPPGCYYELHQNHEELLKDYCEFTLPPLGVPEDVLTPQGPGFIFYYNAALGPLWKVIQQKIQGGILSPGSELRLDIAELEIRNLVLTGSLHIQAEQVHGSLDQEQRIQYNNSNGKCTLININVINKGIKRDPSNVYWKNQVTYDELLKITIQGSGEFFAEGISFEGSHDILVPDGIKMTAIRTNGHVIFLEEKITKPTWHWNYRFDENDQIVLKRMDN